MAAARLKAVEKALASGPADGQVEDPYSSDLRLALVLPDLSPVHLTAQNILINHVPTLRFEVSTTRKYQHLLASVGTSHEANAQHVPRYPLLTLHPSSPNVEPGSHQNATQNTEARISIEDFWSCMYALHHVFQAQEIVPVALSSGVTNADELGAYALLSGLATRPLPQNQGQKRQNNVDLDADVLLFDRGALYQGAGTTTYHSRGFLRSQAGLAPAITKTNATSSTPASSAFQSPITTSSSTPYTYPPFPPFPYAPAFTRTPLSITAHPRRPPRPRAGEVLYRRWCRDVGMMLELRTVDFGQDRCRQEQDGESSPADAPADLVLYNKWHNAPHVERAWHHKGSLEFHRRYLQRLWNNEMWLSGGPQLSRPDGAAKEEEGGEEANAGGGAIGIVMCWDGEPMGWTEIIWVKVRISLCVEGAVLTRLAFSQENHLGPHIPGGAQDYDRALHVLVGEKKFAGPAYCGCLFLVS